MSAFKNIGPYKPEFEENAPDYGDTIKSILSKKKDNIELLDSIQELINEEFIRLHIIKGDESTTDVTGFKTKMESFIDSKRKEYETKMVAINSIKKNLAIKKDYETDFRTNFIADLSANFVQLDIIITENDNKTSSYLKTVLKQYYIQKKGDVNLYSLEVDDTVEKIKIKLKYTELGFIIVLMTEIKHDLSELNGRQIPDYLDSIRDKIKDAVPKDSILLNMFYLYGNGKKPITYTESIATDICLYLLNLKGIPRVIQKEGGLRLQYGEKIDGVGLFPDIKIHDIKNLTYDAHNTANVGYANVLKGMLTKNLLFLNLLLNLDAGSGPTLKGSQEFLEWWKTLNHINSHEHNNNKPVEINVFNPLGQNMVKLDSTNMNQYNISIYPDNNVGKAKQAKQAKQVKGVNNLSVKNVLRIIKTANKDNTQYLLNSSILKSLGDMIVYLCVLLMNVNPEDELHKNITHVLGSADYSMIFQMLATTKFTKNGTDYTDEINKRTILVDVNLSNSNGYFPWSDREKTIYKIIYNLYHAQDLDNPLNGVLQNFNIKKETFKQFVLKQITDGITPDYLDDLLEPIFSKTSSIQDIHNKLISIQNTLITSNIQKKKGYYLSITKGNITAPEYKGLPIDYRNLLDKDEIVKKLIKELNYNDLFSEEDKRIIQNEISKLMKNNMHSNDDVNFHSEDIEITKADYTNAEYILDYFENNAKSISLLHDKNKQNTITEESIFKTQPKTNQHKLITTPPPKQDKEVEIGSNELVKPIPTEKTPKPIRKSPIIKSPKPIRKSPITTSTSKNNNRIPVNTITTSPVDNSTDKILLPSYNNTIPSIRIKDLNTDKKRKKDPESVPQNKSHRFTPNSSPRSSSMILRSANEKTLGGTISNTSKKITKTHHKTTKKKPIKSSQKKNKTKNINKNRSKKNKTRRKQHY
jgi:hypothetical protein